ncbi:GNAT family N-acetyltransferase [Polaromonas sp. UC242_47]|uniref:GNAT family N-acetyltransferase n=1 Tax=Polaromonas sp. UC242_47 TaxID=3374626 RepID=UPI0037B6B36E
MTNPQPAIGEATETDLDGILAPQAANQVARGGTLSAELPRARIEAMMGDMPLVVARGEQGVLGFLMSTTRAMNADFPIIRAMFAAYPGSADAYVYGPICVAASERGKGLAQALFQELRRLQPGREGILFIRRDNEASIRAHLRMGMREVAGFEMNGVAFSVMSFIG